MSENPKEHLENEKKGMAFEPITPIDFSPAKAQKNKLAFRLRWVHGFILAFVLLAVSSGWFVLSAKSVYLQIEPITARHHIEGFAIALGQRYLLLPGEYSLTVSHAGYYDTDTTLLVGGNAAQTFPFQLVELPGFVEINIFSASGELAEASISANGEPIELMSATPIQLAPGTYQFEAKAERHISLRQEVTIQGQRKMNALNFELEPAWGGVSFLSQPSGADVFVDGQLIGVTPYTAEILEGKHDIMLKLPKHKAWSDALEVSAGEKLTLPSRTLEPADGLAFIQSVPSGANVTVNGQYVGLSPIEVALAPGRAHELSLFKSGFELATRRVDAKSDQEQKIEVALKAITSVVNVITQPRQAQLYIDGELHGSANQQVALLAASQTIEIRLDGYIPFTTEFTSRPGLEQELRVTLISAEQAKLDAIKPVIITAAGQTLPLFYPGQFTMGASRREAGRRANEDLREISLERPFYLSTTEVSNAQYKLYRANHVSGTMQSRSLDLDNQPVVQVTWQDAALYCNWLSAQEGLVAFYIEDNGQITGFNKASPGYRLPSEAEWEWAARTKPDGSISRYPWGDRLPPPDGSGNFADQSVSSFMGQYLASLNDGFAGTSQIGAFAMNARGLFDMAGNVSEWVHDTYGTQLSLNNSVEIDPLGPRTGDYHTVKGSSWAHSTVTELRLSYRDFADQPRNDLGFRIARYLED